MTYPISGSCQCGQVTYKLHAAPLAIAACHCTHCQKLSSSAFSITAMVDANALEVSGELKEWSRVADSGSVSTARFCPTCGNHIYHLSADHPDKRMLKPSTLSDTRLIQPTVHVWTREKQDWYQIPETALVFDTQPQSAR